LPCHPQPPTRTTHARKLDRIRRRPRRRSRQPRTRSRLVRALPILFIAAVVVVALSHRTSTEQTAARQVATTHCPIRSGSHVAQATAAAQLAPGPHTASRSIMGNMVSAIGSDPVACGVAGPGAGSVVSRPRLFGRLAAPTRVTVVSGPPGSGKTVLLRSWI